MLQLSVKMHLGSELLMLYYFLCFKRHKLPDIHEQENQCRYQHGEDVWGSMSRIGQKRVCIWRGYHALIAIEVDSPWKCPSLLEGESVLVLLKKHLRLKISKWPCFH